MTCNNNNNTCDSANSNPVWIPVTYMCRPGDPTHYPGGAGPCSTTELQSTAHTHSLSLLQTVCVSPLSGAARQLATLSRKTSAVSSSTLPCNDPDCVAVQLIYSTLRQALSKALCCSLDFENCQWELYPSYRI